MGVEASRKSGARRVTVEDDKVKSRRTDEPCSGGLVWSNSAKELEEKREISEKLHTKKGEIE